MDMMTTEQAGKLWGITPRLVSELCRNGRIKGVHKIGTSWVMPTDAKKPKDERVTTGKWVAYKRTSLALGGGKEDGKKD